MKITVNRQKFRKAFATVGSILTADYLSPHGCVLLSPRNGYVLLTSTNQNMMLQTTVRAQCEPGPNALLPNRVRRAISAIGTKDVRLELLDKSVQISGNKATITIKTPDPQQYPVLQKFVIDRASVAINPTLFRRAVQSTWFATRRFFRTSTPTFQCVNIAVSDCKMIFTSTDGIRIARFVADVSSEGLELADGFLIQPNTLKHLKRLTGKSSVKMCINNSYNLAVFAFSDETRAAVRLAYGAFPNLDAIFASFDSEAEHYETVSLKAAELTAMLSQVSIMSTREHQVIRLSIANNRLWSEIRTPEVGEATCSIDAIARSQNKLVTLDVQLLRDGMAALKHNERVCLSIPDKAMPLRIFTKNFTYVVMPYDNNTQQRHAYNDAIATSRTDRSSRA